MRAHEPYSLEQKEFPAKVTPPDERPFTGDILFSLCEEYAPFALESVALFVKFQQRYDESEGQDDEAAREIVEHTARIWQAMRHGTRAPYEGLNHTEQEAQYRNTW